MTASSERRLPSATEATRYQRAWFAELQARVAAGEPLAVVNADCPQEIFRAMDIPYVVSQWWSSIVAAKQRAGDYLARLSELGYPDYSEQYNAIALGSVLDAGAPDAPWGGLPHAGLLLGEMGSDAERKVLDVWSELDGATHFPLESTGSDTVVTNWWELMPAHWDQVIDAPRLDLLVGEMEGLVRHLEISTGRVFHERRLREVLRLVNEQEEWNRRTRDLLAHAQPAPLNIRDTLTSVMIPQWHRGTEWARDAARQLHGEVLERIEDGQSVCEKEQARLMWIGRGLWFDTAFYEAFEQSHGAVFVWSMYLAIAADGYLRYGEDPMRALAARFAAFSDQLYMPPWSTEWYLKEARLHHVDGVVHLVSEDGRGSWFTTHALREAGLPVYELHADNVDRRTYDRDAVVGDVERWLTTVVLPNRGHD